MEQRPLAGLEPACVFRFFEEICAIPHGSRNTKTISDYLVRFAQERGLRFRQDEWNNVVIFQPGTPGYEDHPPVILQGHMDMVCEKEPDCPIDFEHDGLVPTFLHGVLPWAGMTVWLWPMHWPCWTPRRFPILHWK